jgi:hypothetical protein
MLSYLLVADTYDPTNSEPAYHIQRGEEGGSERLLEKRVRLGGEGGQVHV